METRMERDEKIKKIFCETIGIPESEVKDDTAYNSVEKWDSVRHLQMIAAFEEHLGIEIDMEDIIAMETFKKIKGILGKYIKDDP
jgi:acyl carrier protein